jgi:hypothetical protein
MSLRNRVLPLVLLAIAAACEKGGGTDPEPPPPTPAALRIVSGGGQSDTVQAVLAQPAVVEVLDAEGRPVPGVAVSLSSMGHGDGRANLFIVLDPPGSPASSHVATTGPDGRISARIQLDTLVGTVRLNASAGTLADFVVMEVKPGKPVRIAAAPRDTTLYASTAYTLTVTGLDRYRNPVPAQRTASARATLQGEQVRSAEVGRHFVALQSGTVHDTVRFSVVPPATIAAVHGGYRPNGSTLFTEIVAIDLNGTNQQVVFTVGTTYDVIPRWFAGGDSLLVFEDRPYTDLRKVGFGSPGETFGYPSSLTMRWITPTTLNDWIYVSASAETGEAKSGYQIWRRPPSGPGAEMVTAYAPLQFDNSPDVSPDGRWLAFTRVRGGISDPEELWLRDLASGVETRVADRGSVPRWSPSGTRLAYISEGKLMIVDPRGGVPQQVAQGIAEVSWSPDETYVIVAVEPQSGLAPRLYVIVLATREAIPLTWSRDKDAYYRGPDWRP